MMKNQEAHILFTGRVQGVGFRARALRFATQLGLTGTVQNLSDGSVQLVAQGPAEAIQQLVQLLATPGPVQVARQEFKPLSTKHPRFEII